MKEIKRVSIVGMDAVKLGDALTYSHLGTLCLGIPKGDGRREEKLAALKRVVDLFWRNGLPHEFEPDILHTLYCKWMMNVGINQTIMVVEGTYRTVQQPGPRDDEGGHGRGDGRGAG